ncbi:MAG: right-handed parallel beta-helix repeat-containing protein [Bacteroidales bacterium]|nr:right-handed parallel beta-helix repeat-containing protein [Bacteroidales bacterium]
MKTSKINFYLLAIILLLTSNISAQDDGTLDRTYGVSGIIKTDVESGSIGKQILLPDNSTLILSYNETGSILIKNLEDGSFDESFGENGVAVINKGSYFSIIGGIDVQSDGKIILTGRSEGDNSDKIYLLRLNRDGSADVDFGENGFLLLIEETEADSWAYIKPIRVTKNDKYLVSIQYRSGAISETNFYKSELRQYNNDGTLDSNFGVGGITESPIGDKIIIDINENIYIARAFYGFPNEFSVSKYSKEGIADSEWGDSGSYIADGNSLNIGNDIIQLEGFDVDPYGQIICALEIVGNTVHTLILKLNSEGKLDASWDNDGIKDVNSNRSEEVYFMPDRKIVWGGEEYGLRGESREKIIFLARFNEDGSTDNTFGYEGRTRFSEELADTTDYLRVFSFIKRPNDEKLVVAFDTYETLGFARYLNFRSYSSKYVSGNVSGDWDVDTVYVTGDITIPQDETLEIKPNTYVYFTGEYKMDVYGTLIAKGIKNYSITFASDTLKETTSYPYYEGFWYGITFHSTDENEQTPSTLDYCNIKYAYERWLDEASSQFNRRFGGGLIFYKSTVNVSNTKLSDCYESGSLGGVFTSIYSSGNIKNVSMLRAGSITLLSSDANIESLNMNGTFGLYADSSKVKIKNSIFENPVQYSGHGINAEHSEVEITDCEISNYNGNGIRAEFSSFKIEHVGIKNNGGDGAIFLESPSTIVNCEIIGNSIHGLRFQTVQNWGTIFTSEIKNCVIAKNGATGIKFWSRNTANITNCTIADNTNSSGWGGVLGGEIDPQLNNCIVYNNGSDLNYQAGGLYTYSIIQGNYVGSDDATTNIENIAPLFRDAANDDYHLQSTACGNTSNSPAIDMGDPNISDLVLNCESGGLGTKLSDIGAYGGEDNWWDKSILPGCHFTGEVSGIWDCETITIDGDILIQEGDTLIISEVVKQVLVSGPYQIKVEGVLLAIGAEREGVTKLDTDYIKFQGENWKGILFNNLNDSEVGTSIIANCRFDYADKMDMTYQGGGAIAIYNSDNVEVKHSLFYANSARYGGAMYIEDSNPHIEDCYFELNGKELGQTGEAITTAGGAMYIKNSNPYLHKLQFINNYSITGGGAVVVDNSSLTISNILLAKNETAGMGGAIEVTADITGSLLKVVNMTSADNVSIDNGGGTFHTYGENTELEVINSIMFDNSKVELYVEGKTPVITYSIIEGDSEKAHFGIGCLDEDPLLESSTGMIYRLETSLLGYSPAIDAGHPDSLDAVLSYDEGQGSWRADMGYYGGRYSVATVHVGTLDLSKSHTINIYPNPTQNSVTLDLSMESIGDFRYSVYNLVGQMMEMKEVAGLKRLNIDFSTYKTGIYFIKVEIEDKVYMRQIIKK